MKFQVTRTGAEGWGERRGEFLDILHIASLGKHLLLGRFSHKQRKVAVIFVMSFRLSACESTAVTIGLAVKFDIGHVLRKFVYQLKI